VKYKFPENLFCDVRIEDSKHTNYYLKNGEPEGNSEITIIGAMIRIFDGKMWYSAETNDLDSIQKKIDELAVLAKPNPAILKNKIIKNFSVNKETIRRFNGENDLRKISREERARLADQYYKACVDKKIKELKESHINITTTSTIKYYYNSKGTEI